MTDVKSGHLVEQGAMADAGHNKKEDGRDYQDKSELTNQTDGDGYFHDIDLSSILKSKLNIPSQKDSVEMKNEFPKLSHRKKTPESRPACVTNEDCSCRSMKMSKETASSLDSLSDNSQSIVDFEIDQLFKEILTECHDASDRENSESSSSCMGGANAPAASTSPSSTKSSVCFMRLKQNLADKNLHLEPVYWHCGKCVNSISSLSRSFSMSSSSEDDFEDAESPDDFAMFDDFDMMHSDWDSGLSSNNNSHLDIDDDDEWSVAISILGNFPGIEATRMQRQWGANNEGVPPPYPHRALMYHECQVCLTRLLLRRRVCCDFHICAECMTTYVSMKVNEAKVQIECPNVRCSVLIHRDEVNERLPKDLKDKFAKFLVDANADPLKKTCPACSEVYSIDPNLLSVKKKKLKPGLKVQCPQCSFFWCFLCQAPFHTDMTCKQYRKGDKMVKKWARELNSGQSNAQRCPKCKIFIQKVNGCDHMKCTKCNTDFCYRCGDRYISVKLLGNHWSKFSLFGCKYRLMPHKPALRRLIRGANFAARLLAGVVLAGLGLAAGAVLVGASVIIVPGYGIFRLRRHLQLRERRNRDKGRQTIGRLVERDFPRVIMMPHQATVRSAAESEAESPDNQQVQVIVHRSVSFNHEDSESVRTTQADENCEFYINKYTTEGTDMVVSGLGRNDPDDVIVLTEVTEIQNEGGYPTVVAHIVSKMASDKESSSKSKASNKGIKEGNYDQSVGKTDLPGQAVMKRKHRDNTSDNSVVGDRSAGAETFSADGILKKNGITEDTPSCSWENLSEGGKVHSGHGDLESCQEANSSEAKSGSLANSEDADSTKSSNNGCFGNIFSRRIQAPLPNVEFPAAGKTQIPNFQKKSLSYKAATWEKCHRDYVQSVLKSSPLDPVKDFNNLTSVMQKSPVSSFDVMDIFNSDMKCLQRDVAKHGRKPSESFNPDIDLSDIVSCTTLGNNSEESECATSQDKSDELIQISEGPVDHDFHAGGCYISPCSEITHL